MTARAKKNWNAKPIRQKRIASYVALLAIASQQLTQGLTMNEV
jgi:hypothetical protein